MDTTWFAVDRDGHVAVFDSGEAGAVPTEGYTDDWGPILDELLRAAGKKPFGDGDDDDWEERPARLADAGLYYYNHEQWENALAGPYDRVHAPTTPLAGHDVPRGVLGKIVSFDGRFSEMPTLQPVEHWQSEAWSCAWVASDGESVHCLPGHEEEYAEQIGELEAALEDRPLKIDPPTVGANPRKPPSARALPTRRWWQFWKK